MKKYTLLLLILGLGIILTSCGDEEGVNQEDTTQVEGVENNTGGEVVVDDEDILEEGFGPGGPAGGPGGRLRR